MYAIITDVFDEHMYLAWQPDTWDDGYFWASKETFDECLSKGWNTSEHKFMFRSHYQAIDAMLKLDIPKSWKSRVIKL